ncbi:MAG: hypothetical protein R2747_22560 [Pyrinomonadaceae bacterium]
MNTEEYDNQAITDYLLGDLSETETEHFDELSFIDDDFADRLGAAEKDLLDAYVRGELSGETLEKFETFYLASPLRRQKVEFAESFQVFAEKKLADSRGQKVLMAATKTGESRGGLLSVFDLFRNSKPIMQAGFAALLLLFLGLGGWFLFNNLKWPSRVKVDKTPTPQETIPATVPTATAEPTTESSPGNKEDKTPAPPTPETGPTRTPVQEKTPALKPSQAPEKPPRIPPKPTLASFVLAPPVRGGGQIEEMSFPAGTETIAVELQLELDDFPAYRVSLTDRSGGKSLWQSGRIKSKKSGENGSLNIRFPAKLLQNGIYNLRVSGLGENGTAEEMSSYPFRVVIK